jgi:hypothetical protein
MEYTVNVRFEVHLNHVIYLLQNYKYSGLPQNQYYKRLKQIHTWSKKNELSTKLLQSRMYIQN